MDVTEPTRRLIALAVHELDQQPSSPHQAAVRQLRGDFVRLRGEMIALGLDPALAEQRMQTLKVLAESLLDALRHSSDAPRDGETAAD